MIDHFFSDPSITGFAICFLFSPSLSRALYFLPISWARGVTPNPHFKGEKYLVNRGCQQVSVWYHFNGLSAKSTVVRGSQL